MVKKRHQKLSAIQIIITWVLGILIYIATGHLKYLMPGQYVSSHDIRRLSSIMNNPAGLRSMMQDKLKQNPEDKMAWKLLGVSYHHLGEHDKALQAMEKAVELEKFG